MITHTYISHRFTKVVEHMKVGTTNLHFSVNILTRVLTCYHVHTLRNKRNYIYIDMVFYYFSQVEWCHLIVFVLYFKHVFIFSRTA